MNDFELNAIYEDKILSSEDLKKVSQGISAAVANKYTNDFNLKALVNHPLLELLFIPRKSSYLFNEDNFGKYANLASTLLKFNTERYQEGFTGAITYLALVDMKFGLDNISKNGRPKDISDILRRIDSGRFDDTDMQSLVDISTSDSNNFEYTKGKISNILNNLGKRYAKGVIDRRYYNFHIHDAGRTPINQGSQVSRGAEAAIKEENYFPEVLQVATDSAISKNQECFNSRLNTRELIALSNLKNTTELLAVYANLPNEKRQDIDPLGSLCEIYTNYHKESVVYFNDLNSEEDIIGKIKLYSDTVFSIANEKLTTDEISNNIQDASNEFVILPLIELTRVLKKLKASNSSLEESYNRGLGIINKHKDNLTKYSAIERMVEVFVDIKVPENIDYNKTRLNRDIEELFVPNRIVGKSTEDLVCFFLKTKSEFNLQELTREEIDYLKSIPEKDMSELLVFYKEIATKNIENIYKGIKGGKTAHKIQEVVGPFVEPDVNKRTVYGRQTTDNLYVLLRGKQEPQHIAELEVIFTLKEITNGNFSLTNGADEKLKTIAYTLAERKLSYTPRIK
jgi:hypothetical protein